MAKTTQDERLLKLSTPLAKDFLLIDRIRCVEGLNQLFRVELDMLHEEPVEGFEPTAVDPKKLLGNPMSVEVDEPGETARFFHGICVSFTQGSRNERFSGYRSELVPKVWILTQNSQSRIFQNKTVPEIIEEVLKGYEFDNEIQPRGMKPRNYCVQYRESDWNFISRLMEEEGIYYYFEHTKDNHKLILGNTPGSHRKTPTISKVNFALERPDLKEKWIPSIYNWSVADRVFTGKYELRDHNFQLPTSNLQAIETSLYDVGKNKTMETYDWPGYYAKRYDGIDPGGGEAPAKLDPVFQDRERTVGIRQEELDAGYKQNAALSNCCALTAGYRFSMAKHPTKTYNVDYVIVTAEHESYQTPFYIPEERGEIEPYAVSFTCMPHGGRNAPFRPARKTRKPIVHGGQTAKVVGNPGDEIFTDKYGRVKVHFPWDRSDFWDQRASAWIRVSTSLSGSKWGTIFIPRVGQEVLVNFLEGDPDQPIIVGTVYNPENMPPYDLPANKTQSGYKSRSTLKGTPDNFNEFRFEDKKGQEEIYLHAEKDWTIMVENDVDARVIHNRTEVIGSGEDLEKIEIQGFREEVVTRDETITIMENRKRRVIGDHQTTVNGKESNNVTKDRTDDIGTDYKLKAATSIEESSSNITITAGTKLTLAGPGGTIVIDGRGITINGVLVKIN